MRHITSFLKTVSRTQTITRKYLATNIAEYVVRRLEDTTHSDDCVPSLLVFGTIPEFPMENRLTDKQRTIIKMIETAREKGARMRAEQRGPETIKYNVPQAQKSF